MIDEKIKQKDLSIKDSICLYYLYNGKLEYVSSMLKGYSNYNYKKLLETLANKGYITVTTPKLFTVKTVKAFFDKGNVKNSMPSDVSVLDSPSKVTDINSLIKQFRRLFAQAKKGRSGALSSTKARMIKFITENSEYNEDDILKAAKNYVDSQRNENYKYLKRADNFIYKTSKDATTGELITTSSLLQELEDMEEEVVSTRSGGGFYDIT